MNKGKGQRPETADLRRRAADGPADQDDPSAPSPPDSPTARSCEPRAKNARRDHPPG